MLLAVSAMMAMACWVSPAAATGRAMIELVTADGSPVSTEPTGKMYNWSDTSPTGIMRGMPDIPLTDPRLQPGPEGYPEQVSTMYYGPTTIRFGWSTGETDGRCFVGGCNAAWVAVLGGWRIFRVRAPVHPDLG